MFINNLDDYILRKFNTSIDPGHVHIFSLCKIKSNQYIGKNCINYKLFNFHNLVKDIIWFFCETICLFLNLQKKNCVPF